MTEYISKDRVRDLLCKAERKYPTSAANCLIQFLLLLNKEPAADVIPSYREAKLKQ